MAKVPYGVETLPKISIVWVGRTNVTDDRRTDDDIIANMNLSSRSLIKPYFTKMAIYPLLTFHMLRPFHVFSNTLDVIEAEQSIHQNVQYFIWSKKSVFYLLLLDILCTSAVKGYCD